MKVIEYLGYSEKHVHISIP